MVGRVGTAGYAEVSKSGEISGNASWGQQVEGEREREGERVKREFR